MPISRADRRMSIASHLRQGRSLIAFLSAVGLARRGERTALAPERAGCAARKAVEVRGAKRYARRRRSAIATTAERALESDRSRRWTTCRSTVPTTNPFNSSVRNNGRVDKPGAVEEWSFEAKKGAFLLFELRAAQLGSPLQGVLTVCDAAGKELANIALRRPDCNSIPSLAVQRASGTRNIHRARCRGAAFRHRGGPEFAYRLRLAPAPPPSFKLQLVVDALTLPRGGSAKLKVTAERLGGFTEPIFLTVSGLPTGVKANPAMIAANQNAVEIIFVARQGLSHRRGPRPCGRWRPTRFPDLRRSGHFRRTWIIGHRHAAAWRRDAGAVQDCWRFRYAETRRARLRLQARKYKLENCWQRLPDGPIEISLADRQARHLQGVTGPTLTVPPGVQRIRVHGAVATLDGNRPHMPRVRPGCRRGQGRRPLVTSSASAKLEAEQIR